MEECTPFIKEHVVEVCRDECAERSIGPDGFRACVEACVEDLKQRCSKA
ncbi:MAG: hypothetical protein ACP5HK_01030 [Acidilobus sp.]